MPWKFSEITDRPLSQSRAFFSVCFFWFPPLQSRAEALGSPQLCSWTQLSCVTPAAWHQPEKQHHSRFPACRSSSFSAHFALETSQDDKRDRCFSTGRGYHWTTPQLWAWWHTLKDFYLPWGESKESDLNSSLPPYCFGVSSLSFCAYNWWVP